VRNRAGPQGEVFPGSNSDARERPREKSNPMSIKSEQKKAVKNQKQRTQKKQHRDWDFIGEATDALQRKDYDALARAGVKQSHYYMSDDIGNVSNDQLSHAPEFHIFKDGKLNMICAAPDVKPDDFHLLLEKFFKTEPQAVLLITSGYFSKTAHEHLSTLSPEAHKEEFAKRPYSSYPDKITVAQSRVYLAPDNIVASALRAVGTEAELAAAGFDKNYVEAKAALTAMRQIYTDYEQEGDTLDYDKAYEYLVSKGLLTPEPAKKQRSVKAA
jgi:hypothetical protein